MRQRTARLVTVGNVLVDIAAYLPHMPLAGADVLADSWAMTAGGSFNTVVSATRQGLPSAAGGAIGTGVFGDLVRQALREADVEILLAPTAERDTGYVLVLVEPGGERRFVTAFGAESDLTSDQLGELPLRPDDLVHVSGYGLLDRTNVEVIPPWLATLPTEQLVLFDPGPAVADIPSDALLAVLTRADWISCNEHEARLITGEQDPGAAAGALAQHGGGVVVRLGPAGCLVSRSGSTATVPGFRTDVVDTTGAGDAHIGAFLAALAQQHDPVLAARRANACAAIAVSRRGPATAPGQAEVQRLLHSH